jgi:pilus assembly protein CpaC
MTKTTTQWNGILERAVRWAAVVLPLLVGAKALGQVPAPALPAPATQSAGEELVTRGVDPDGHVGLIVGKSRLINTRVPVDQVSVGNPDIADVNIAAVESVLVTGKKPGATQVIVWDQRGRSQTVDVLVTSDLKILNEQMKGLIPNSAIEVQNAGGAIALSGRVPNIQAAEQAEKLATPYGTKVLNFLEVAGGKQVMLQVKFAEVSRAATSALGVNFGFTDGKAIGASNIGQLSPLSLIPNAAGNPSLGVPSPSPNVTVFGRGVVGNTALDFLIQALRSNNLLRILAQPNVTAISGQKASLLAGGEFPVPVPQTGQGSGGSTAITIEYREFGVRLNFVPVVLGDGKIRLQVSPEVSDLDFSAGVVNQGFRIPIINKRKVDTTVELTEGQTFAIAGLLSHSVNASSDATPGLSDMPFIGALFRSVRYERRETELLVLVTPYLVEGMNPDQVPAVPGEKWRHPTENELFWDRDLGGPEADKKDDGAIAKAPAKFKGEYGFQPADTSTVATTND